MRFTTLIISFLVGPKQRSRVELSRLDHLLETQRSQLAAGRMDPPWFPSPRSSMDDDRFQYLFDFLRDGKVKLPHDSTVTKETLLNELQYDGLDQNATDIMLSKAIEVSSRPSPPPEVYAVEAAEYIYSLEEACEERIKELDEEQYPFEYKRNCEKLALYIFRKFKETNKWKIHVDKYDDKDLFVILSATVNDRPKGFEKFHHDCLAHFGLAYKFIENQSSSYPSKFVITH